MSYTLISSFFSDNHFATQTFFTVKVRFQYLRLNHHGHVFTKIGSTTRVLGATEIVNIEKRIVRKICLFTKKFSRFWFSEHWFTSHYQAYLPVQVHVCQSFHIALLRGEKEDFFTVKHCVSVNNIHMSLILSLPEANSC